MIKYTARLIILWYDYFGKNQTPLKRKGLYSDSKNLALRMANHLKTDLQNVWNSNVFGI